MALECKKSSGAGLIVSNLSGTPSQNNNDQPAVVGSTSHEVVCGTSKKRTPAEVDLREVYFLIMHFLSGGPCHKTCAQFLDELSEHNLLPRRYHAWYSRAGACSGDSADDGISVPLSYPQLLERYSFIERNHLVKLLEQLYNRYPEWGSHYDARNPTAADASTLLGIGSVSILNSDQCKKKQGGCLWKPAGQTRGLTLRELGGGLARHHRSPSIRAASYAIVKPSVLVDRIKIIKTFRGHRNAVYCAIFDKSGEYIITGSDDRLVKIWSTAMGFCLRSCRGHEGDITDLAVSANNVLVASASNDCFIRVWRFPDGLPVSVLKGHTSAVTAIAFSPRLGCEHHLLSTSDDGTCRIWDARDSSVNARIYAPKSEGQETESKVSTSGPQNSQSGTQILCCAFNASGTVFVTGSADKLARVWDACKWTDEHHGAPNHELDTLKGHEDDVNYVQFSGCAGPSRPINTDAPTKDERISRFRNSWYGYESIVTCSRDGSAIIWGPRSRKYHGKSKWTKAYHLRVPPPPMPPQPPRGVPRQRLLPTPRGVNMIVWSLDNRYVLAAIMDCRICVWNAVDGSLVHSLTGHTKSTFVLDVHPYDPRLAMSAGYDGRVIIWDIWEGRTIHVYEIGEFHLVDGKFSPDGTSIVISDEVGQIYLLATGEGESQKDAKYDQFFLGDYRPLMRDIHGNVLDQETQLPPHQRNLQDLLCDASMVPYAEPYQSMYQQRRLGAIGISWQPPSVPFAVGTMDDSSYVPTILPGMLLAPDEDDSLLGAHQGGNRWVEQPVDEDVMEWEQDSVDDAGSDYTLSHENATDEDEREGSLSSTEELLDSLEEEDSSDDEETNQRTHLRRSERNKRKAESTSSGRLAKRKCKERGGEYSLRRSKRRLKRKSLSRRSSRNSSDDEQPKRPKRLAARNARLIFSQISADEDDQVSPWQDTPSDSSENLQSSGEEQVSGAHSSEKESEGVQKAEHAVTAETDPSEVDYSRRTRSKSSIKSKYGNTEGHKSFNTESALDQVTEGAASSPVSNLEAVHGSTSTSKALYQSSPKEKATGTNCNEKVKETAENSGDSLHSGGSKHEEQRVETEGEVLLGKRAPGDVNWKLKKRARMDHSMERCSQFNEDGPSSSRSDDRCQMAHEKSEEYANGMGIPVDLAQSTGGSSDKSDKGNQQGEDQCILEASEVARTATQEAVQRLQADAGDHFDSSEVEKGERRDKLGNSHDHAPAKDICNTEEEEVSSKLERMFNRSGSCSDEQSVQEPGSPLEKEANGVNIDGGSEGITNSYLKHNQHEFLGQGDSIGEERQLGTELESCPSEEDTLLKEELGFLEGEQGFSQSEATVSQERTPIAKNTTVEKFYSRREHVVPKGEDLLLSNTCPSRFEKNRTPSVYFRRTQMRGTSWQRDSPTCLWLRQHTEAQAAERTPSLDGSSDGEKLLDKTEQGEASDEGTKTASLRRSGRKASKQIKGGSIEPRALQNGQRLKEKSERNTAYGAEEIGRLLDPKKTKIIFRTRRTAEASTSGTAQHNDRTNASNHEFGVDKKESRFSLRPRGDVSWKDGTLHKDSSKGLDDLSWKGKKRSKKKASWVMLTKVEEGTRYIPQLGDEVAYVLQGQDEFPDIRHLEDKGPPKALRARLRSVEICRVVGLDYATLAGFSGVTCKLTLKLIDEDCKACGKTFKLSLPELIDFPDFLIERSRYEAGIRRNWTKRDKCKVWWRTNTVDENGDEKAGEWYIGRVVAVMPKSEEFSDSPWEECIVQYKGDNTGPHRHSPWELFDIESSEITSTHLDDSKKHQVLSVIEEVEDSCRSSQDDYGLNRLSKLLHRADFLSKTLVPLSLETIKARLENNYYRSLEALHHDVELLVTNVTFDPELSSKVRKLASRLLGDEG